MALLSMDMIREIQNVAERYAQSERQRMERDTRAAAAQPVRVVNNAPGPRGARQPRG